MSIDSALTPDDRSVLSAIYGGSPDAIIGLTPGGVVTSWSPSAERAYGLPASKMVGSPIDELIPEAVRSAERRLLQRVAAGESIAAYDSTRRSADGRQMLVSMSLSPIVGADGSIVGIAAIERDVTRQRALEAQLLQAKRMEGVARLASGVAQEFNNIHTAILGLADFASEALPTESPARTDLVEIGRQSMRGSRLARQLLGFTARPMRQNRPANANETIRAAEPLLHRLVGERVWLTTDLASQDAIVAADESQLELILFELVIHASDTIGERGTITVETEVREDAPAPGMLDVTVRCEPVAGTEVRANSPLDSLFDAAIHNAPFAFGLVMASSVVQQLGGTLEARSGDGSRFTRVSLPLARDLPQIAELPDAEESVGNETVLLVEDEAPVRGVVGRALRERGYDVLEAKNGDDALVVVEKHNGPVHLVVSDVVMPGMDGRALFDRLRGWYPNIRYLFVSGYARGAISAEQLGDERTSFVAKPFSMNTLGREVRRLLDTRYAKV